MLISAERINKILRACLFTNEELEQATLDEKGVPVHAVCVHGIMIKVGLHPSRLNDYREEIRGYLMNLDPRFLKSNPEGGGYSFLNACNDKEGTQWGEHRNMDQLFILGQAVGLAKCLLSRDLWPNLPGGMPYYVVLDDVEGN